MSLANQVVDISTSIWCEYRVNYTSICDVEITLTATKLISKIIEILLDYHTLVYEYLNYFLLRQIT